jgi:hypothetical protein
MVRNVEGPIVHAVLAGCTGMHFAQITNEASAI